MRVLIAVDESDCSKKALESVLDRCWSKTSRFRVISVFEPSDTVTAYSPALYSPGAYDAIAKAEHEEVVQRQEFVNDAIELLTRHLIAAEVTGEVLTGEASDRILNEAREWKADLIICGTHGRRGIAKVFCGSVAETVANNSECSVEIVKTKSTDAA